MVLFKFHVGKCFNRDSRADKHILILLVLLILSLALRLPDLFAQHYEIKSLHPLPPTSWTPYSSGD